MPTFAAVLDTPATSGSPSTADLKLLQDKIAQIEAAMKSHAVWVVRDHKPTDAETNGSWRYWQSQIVNDKSELRINFFRYVAGNYCQQLLADADEIVLPWEATAIYDSAKKTYTQQIGGAAVEYSKESPRYQVPNADAKFSNMRWQAFADLQGLNEIGNGGSKVVFDPNNPDFLNVIQSNPTLSQGRPIKKIRLFLQPKDSGDEIMYEVNL